MKLLHRIGYYLGGFAIGIILLFFFLGGKKTSCAYGPNARVLKNIRIKERAFSPSVLSKIQAKEIDTADISVLLNDGNVNFSKSNTKLDSCKTYFIEGFINEKEIEMLVRNCDSTATIQHITPIK
ncbi:DUF4258 domain-containing protein [Aquimarina sp. TRL1]|uniref:DUF4258 domain-containing protein n=1 Tax=Aquimarina sp. (strain TRL1) TaxID=2736252 RepID=UPI00158B2E04|nr:DUF4258 domain-containing protein [Aquimarina sp. TRL1]QKX06497.1 DUF4258 domain-containing protein [Aquimarina sp. TRL1]